MEMKDDKVIEDFLSKINHWGQQGIPFFFVIDFEMKHPLAYELSSMDPKEMLFEINGFSNAPDSVKEGFHKETILKNEIIRKHPIQPEAYNQKFNKVYERLAYGDSFLTNLTIDTEIHLSHSLKEIFFMCEAKYKLWFKDNFIVFSPETFVKIEEGKIYSNPMKGTIDASIPDAESKILNDRKELAEHITIVDLIRNDLSQVAKDVRVERFRYVEEVRTNTKTLLQVSSEIAGELNGDYSSHLGDILVTLLPAGSVSGAPKPKTLEIIRDVETKDRGYYTGVFGYFDGMKLDSGVMIRFIEKRQNGYFYRSGGGITTQSSSHAEYQEAIDKVYVPVN